MTDKPRPQPLVPPTADLRHFPKLMLDIVKVQNSETWAIADGWQAKAAVNLWMRAWHQVPAGSLPADEVLLAKWADVPQSWDQIRRVAMRGFVLCSDGRWYHRILCEDVLRAIEFSERQSRRSNSRWTKTKPLPRNKKTNDANRQDRTGQDSKKESEGQTALGFPEGGNVIALQFQKDDDWPADYFERFWAKYPPGRKTRKPQCRRKLDQIRRRGVSWALIESGLDRYVASRPGEFVRGPLVWLNGDGWEDEIGAHTPRRRSFAQIAKGEFDE